MVIKSHNRNVYYRICHRNVGKHYRNIKTTSHCHNLHLLLYKPAEHFPSSLDRFLEYRKCNILVITQALMLCLINTHMPSGIVCIYYAKHSCLCYNLYINTSCTHDITTTPAPITLTGSSAITS